MQQSFSQRQSPANLQYPLSARDQSKIGSSRLFHGDQNQFQNKRQINRQEQILSIIHSENEFKIRSFKQSFSMLPDIETIQFQDGSRYEGQIIDQGVRHGIGIFQTVDGDIYLGDWQQDLYHGYGLYVYHDGQRYEGQLFQGMKEGQGKYFYKDGRVYEGQWNNDQRQGQGIQRDQIKGVYYQGQWSNDQKQGHGRIYLLSGMNYYSQQPTILFEGIWSRNIFTQGVIKSQVYQGQFRNQTLTGKGVYKFPDGSVYNGQFYNNLFHGQGIYYYPNGDIYEGGFICGLKSGSGIYKYFTGDVYDGEYEKDLKSGQGKFIFVNGNFYVGQFQKDSFHGNGKYFFNQNQSITGTWHYGKLLQNKTVTQLSNYNNLAVKNLPHPINKTPNKNERSRSPLRYPSSISSSMIRRSSPYSHQRVHTNNFQRHEKAGVIHTNPSRSPIKNTQFLNVNTPGDSYFKPNSQIPSSAQNFNNFSASKQKKSHIENQKSNQFSNFTKPAQTSNLKSGRQIQEPQSQYQFNKLITKQNERSINFSQNKISQNGKQLQYHTQKKIESKNLFHLMNGDIEQEQYNNVPPLPLSEPKIQKIEQGPKKSKRKLQYR